MQMLPVVVLVTVAGYLIGAIPFGYLLGRWRGIDIRQQGSGNIGATNVGRVLGRRFGILVFLLDFAKGAVPCAVAQGLAADLAPVGGRDLPAVAAGLAAFLGHLFPIYLRFRGGKGVATGAGVVTVLLPGPAVAALLTWVVVVSSTRYVSLASLTAVVVLCLVRGAGTPQPWSPENRILTIFCFVAAALVCLRHRSNVQRLLHATENRLPDSPAMSQLTKTLHVLALGLWFGSAVFFSLVTAPIVFATFARVADEPTDKRPAWLAPSFNKENANQLSGMVVGPIFPWYFLLQGVCGLVAVVTAASWRWSGLGGRLDRIRFGILALALAAVLVGWPLELKVSALSAARYATDPTTAAEARAVFGQWHGFSLLLNFVTLGLVTAGMALAARLPVSLSREHLASADPVLAKGSPLNA
jgi:acyl-phosphate glycerol 3-phosphate acyltransferase